MSEGPWGPHAHDHEEPWERQGLTRRSPEQERRRRQIIAERDFIVVICLLGAAVLLAWRLGWL